MTQSPQQPQMPPPEPLDASEQALARALRNLPVGAPPPELDARILGAARRAVHLAQPRKRDRRWLVGLGTAASALLAIGVLVKTHAPDQGGFTPPASTTSPAPAPAQEPTSASAAGAAAAAATSEPLQDKKARDSADATLETAAKQIAPADNAAPPPSREMAPPAESGRQQAQQATGPSGILVAKQAPSAFPAQSPAIRETRPATQNLPAPPPPPVVLEESTPMSPRAPSPMPVLSSDERAERKAEQDGAARRDSEAGYAAAPASAPVAGAPSDRADMSNPKTSAPPQGAIQSRSISAGALKSSQPAATGGSTNTVTNPNADDNLDRVEVDAGRIEHAKDSKAPLPAVDDDAMLPPSLWIERIRVRVKAADGVGARQSLQRFRVRYPDAGIPDDLQHLLQ